MTKGATRRKSVSTATSRRTDMAMEQTSGNFALIDTLRRWGITFFSGVNGGGLIHVTKHLEPFLGLDQIGDGTPRMQTMGEYVAGFVPLGTTSRRAALRAASPRQGPPPSSARAAS